MSRIAIFTYSIFTVGGEQRVVSLIANKLSEKHKVTIFTMDRENSGKSRYNINESNNPLHIICNKKLIEHKTYALLVCNCQYHSE